jgi:hypothetical protein
LLDSVTAAPPAGAAALSVAEIVALPPLATVVGEIVNEVNVGGKMVT